MTILEIIETLDEGNMVHFTNDYYQVLKSTCGMLFIQHEDDDLILIDALNFDESDFYIGDLR